MKFVILLLAFFIPLLTSTEALRCYLCNSQIPQHECGNLEELEVTGDTCPVCLTWFYADGKLDARSCFDGFGIPNPDAKTGCQTLENGGKVCVCDTDKCNGDGASNAPKGRKINGRSNNNNTCQMVGMPLTTLLGGVLALSLWKYL